MKRIRCLRISGFLSVLLLQSMLSTGVLFAQTPATDTTDLSNLSLDQLLNIEVTTASKKSEKISDAPAIISVVTAKEIENFGAQSIGEVLDRVANVYMMGSAAYPNNMVVIRGGATESNNTQVLFLLDGRPVTESVTQGNNTTLNFGIPLSSVERIEIIRGPGSVLYGSGAFLGVINIITKKAEKSNVQVKGYYGSFGTAQAEASGGTKIGDLSINGSAQYKDSKGWDFSMRGESDAVRNKSNTGDSLLRGPTSVKYYQKVFGAALKASYKGITLNSFYGDDQQGNVGATPSWSKPPQHAVGARHLFVDGGYSHEITSFWNACLNVTYNYFYLSQFTPIDSFKDSDTKRVGNEGVAELTNYFTPTDNVNVIVGFSANKQMGEQTRPTLMSDGITPFNINKGVNPDPLMSVPKYNTMWYAGYAQVDYTPFSFVKVVAGGQVNKVPNIKADFVPRLGAIFNITKELHSKLLYGQAFRSASNFELGAYSVPSVIGNQNLHPEKIGTFEAQVSYANAKFEGSVTYYNSNETDQIIRSLPADSLKIVTYLGKPTSVPMYVNRGTLTLQGVEFEGKILATKEIDILGSLSLQHTKDQSGTQDNIGMPMAMGKLGLEYNSPFGLNLGVFNSYFGRGGSITSYTATGVQITRNANPMVDAFDYLSLNVSCDIVKLVNLHNMPSISLNFYAQNLLDADVYYPEYTRRNINSIPGRPGRALYGGITVRF